MSVNVMVYREQFPECKIWGFHGGDYEELSSGMLRHVAVVITDVSEEPSASLVFLRSVCCSWFPDSCHPDEWGAKFLRNVGSYKSHTA
jgi:hypothetical protein